MNIKTEQQAAAFEAELNKEEVDIKISNEQDREGISRL